MKNIKITGILVLFSILFLFSCENEPVNTTSNLNPTNSVLPISFKVGFSGQTYVATEVNAVIINGLMTLYASKGIQKESFTIPIPEMTIGSYPTNKNIILYSGGVSQPIYQSINPADAYANTGQIKITSVNTGNMRISGNFDFTGFNKTGNLTLTKEFTNGVFTNIPYVTK
ncbi:DUF6252 family protein [Flavobacterium psychrotolerans]|uniref:Uncharacterized protein n=1 Tax=Flavobacterium psychrotolerans TaxID=2169410 RepID=A0A2U1JHW2_9FLAO|nr:DUF6252 family protein [Flavobacterium psychrotolerans]PWA04736.1 hypothetical protein DB895_09615 [Flavobacterium psychrotolerans]